MKETKAVSQFSEEFDELKKNIRENLWDGAPEVLVRFSGEYNEMFSIAIIDKWFGEKKYEELIDYLLYHLQDEYLDLYLWKIIRELVFELNGNDQLESVNRLLDGLLKSRKKIYKIKRKNYKDNPENYLSYAQVEIGRANMLRLLYEKAWVYLNHKKADLYKDDISNIEDEIKLIASDLIPPPIFNN